MISLPRSKAFLGLSGFIALQTYAMEAPTVVETDDTIVIRFGDNPAVTYQKALVPPPAGVDPIYTRSGFIHPVRSPSGEAVTGIHPDDHYHHLGLWHAWVKTKVDGQDVDFWNLKEETGAVRFARTLSLLRGSDVAGFTVEQEHVLYPGDPSKESVMLKEQFTVEARYVDGAYEIDYITVQENISQWSLKMPAYRYGGTIAYRAPHHWDKTNSDYLSSEWKTRIDGHTTRSRWIAMWGQRDSGEGYDTFTILCHDENHDAPQRMRVWPPSSNNGAIFFNYVPAQEFDFEIKPGQVSTMQYRLVVEEERPNPYTIDQRWPLKYYYSQSIQYTE